MLDETQVQQLKREFERCKPILSTAICPIPNTHTLDEIREACVQGMMQLWPGKAAVLLTEIHQHPHRKGCFVRAIGGDSIEGTQIGERVAKWAREVGCDHVVIPGRPKWAGEFGEERVSMITVVELRQLNVEKESDNELVV